MRASCWSLNRLCSLFVSEFPKQGMDSRSLPGTVENSLTDVFAFKLQSHTKYGEKRTNSVRAERTGRAGDDGQKSACAALQNMPATAGKNKTTPLCRLRTQAQGRVCSPHKTVYLKTGTTGSQQKDVFGLHKTCTSKRVRDTART